ncbi:MAG: hypothetical protein FJ335_13525, partial [Sphingomonadales bacterium]|nr:hypothetical protein [Sphingomonadales bacterium]
MVPIDLVQIADYVAADGVARSGSGDYALVQDKDHAAQLAAYAIYDGREITLPPLALKPRFIGYRIGDLLTANIAELGLVDQPVLVRGRRIDPKTGIVTLTLVTETPGKHAEALGRTGVAPPVPRLTYDLLQVPAPDAADWAAVGGTVSNDAGHTIPAITVTGSVANTAADGVVFDFRKIGTTDWVNPSIDAPDMVRKVITDVAPKTSYQVGVRYKVAGVIGDRLILGEVTTGEDSTADRGERVPYVPGAPLNPGNVVGLPDGSEWRWVGQGTHPVRPPMLDGGEWELVVAPPAVIPPTTVIGGTLDPATGVVTGGQRADVVVPRIERIPAIEAAIAPIPDLSDKVRGLLDAAPAQDAAIAALVDVSANHGAALATAARAAADAEDTMLSVLAMAAEQREILRDAGIDIDPASGKVTIHAIDQLAERLTTATIEVDAVKGQIVSRVTRAELDDAILQASIDPSQIAELGPLLARVATAESRLDAQQAAIDLKATVVELSATKARVSTAEQRLDAAEAAIDLRVTRTLFDGLAADVSEARAT